MDEAHDIMAECYGTLGRLESERDALEDECERLRDVLDEYERQTKALPFQHEIPERGCSTYNWRMAVIRDLRAALAASTGQEVEK